MEETNFLNESTEALSNAQETIEPTAPVVSRKKVGVVEQRITTFTVYAATPEEAVELVKQGFGRHAGSYGPNVVQVLVDEDPLSDSIVDVNGNAIKSDEPTPALEVVSD